MEREAVYLGVDGEYQCGDESNNIVAASSAKIDSGMNVECIVLVSFYLICGG